MKKSGFSDENTAGKAVSLRLGSGKRKRYYSVVTGWHLTIMRNGKNYMAERIDEIEILDENAESPALICFSHEMINHEIRRGVMIRRQFQKTESSKGYRYYTATEQQLIPETLLAYLHELEKRGELSSMQREWVLESVVEEAVARGLNAVPKSLFVSMVFLIQGIDGMLTGEIPLSWKQFPEGSGRLH